MMEYRIPENYPSISPAAEEPPYVAPSDLPLVQKIALLWMRTENQRAKIVSAEVEMITKARPCFADFTSLVEARFASRAGNRHQLTISGTLASDYVARELALQMGIHKQINGSTSRYTCSMFCTCGEIFSLSLNQGHIESQKMRAFGRHLERVSAPGWKPHRPVQEMIDDLLSKLKAG